MYPLTRCCDAEAVSEYCVVCHLAYAYTKIKVDQAYIECCDNNNTKSSIVAVYEVHAFAQ